MYENPSGAYGHMVSKILQAHQASDNIRQQV